VLGTVVLLNIFFLTKKYALISFKASFFVFVIIYISVLYQADLK